MEQEIDFLPTIPVKDLVDIIKSSSKIEKEFRIGTTISIIFKGKSYIGKRSISLRDNIEEIDYEHAIGIAHKASKLSAVMDWFEKNKHFKEGGYTTSENQELTDESILPPNQGKNKA